MDSDRDISGRVSDLKVISAELLTPLFKQQLHHILQYSSSNSRDVDLEALLNQIEDHWVEIHTTLASHAHLISSISLIHDALVGILLQDYTNKPYAPSPWVSSLAQFIREHDASASTTDVADTAYNVRIALPLKELMVDESYVKQKILSAVDSAPRSNVKLLIERCDWVSLETALKNDHGLALTLFEGYPFTLNSFDARTCKKVLGSIGKKQSKYLGRAPRRHDAGDRMHLVRRITRVFTYRPRSTEQGLSNATGKDGSGESLQVVPYTG